MKKIHVFLLFALCIWGCQTKELLVYSSSQNGNSDLYLLEPTSLESVLLTRSPFEEWAPSLTADGLLTYLHQVDDSIYRFGIDLDNMQNSPLEHPSTCLLDDKNILYSPDGQWKLFACQDDIFLEKIDGSKTTNLTKDLSGRQYKTCWFPSSQKIAFTSTHEGNPDIFQMNIDGTGLTNLTQLPSNEEAPDISPNGKLLLFATNKDGKDNYEIYVKDLKDGSLTNISQTPNWELIGRWSVDGKKIYYGSNQKGNWDIFEYDLKKKKTRQLTFSEEFDGDPRPIKWNKK